MRIRKHARILAPSVSTPPTVPDTHKCQLNRSPWDVSAFTQEFEYQVKIEDKNTYNRVRRESGYDPYSISASEGVEEEDYAPYIKKKGRNKIVGKKKFDYIRCGKIDGKGWQCKKEVKQGELLCEHHLIQLETYKHRYNYSYTSRKAKTVEFKDSKNVVTADKKRKRVRISSSSAMEFYYYSGFGPTYALGRRRVHKNETVKEDEDIVIDIDDHAASPSLVSSDGVHDDDDHVIDNTDQNRGLFYNDEESDDEEKRGDTKRMRKPIKERSLSSLFLN